MAGVVPIFTGKVDFQDAYVAPILWICNERTVQKLSRDNSITQRTESYTQLAAMRILIEVFIAGSGFRVFGVAQKI